MNYIANHKKTRPWRRIIALLVIVGFVASVVRIFLVKPTPVYADSLFTLNEGYGTSTNDSNGAVSAGTITGAVWKTDDLCRKEKCLYFDGSGDRVLFGDDADLDFVAADDFTITGWFRHPVIATNPDYAVTKHESGAAGGYKVYMDSDGDIVFGVDDDGTWDTADIVGDDQGKNYDDNKWHFFAAQKDGTTGIYLYVDGVLIDQDTSLTETGTLANAASFYIGIDADGSSNAWEGFLDEIKVYRSLRTTAELNADQLGETPSRGLSASFGPDQSYLSNGLVGYWKMDESSWDGTAGEIIDSSGNGNNGTVAAITGTATGTQTSTTLQDTSKSWTVNQFANHSVKITGGTGSGQTRFITSNTSDTLTVPTWTTTPVSGSSTYSITPLSSGKFGGGSEHIPASSEHLSVATTITGVKTVSFWTNPNANTNYFISLTSGAYITASGGTMSATGFTNPKIYVNGTESTSIAANSWQLVIVTTDTAIDANQFYVGRQGSNYYDGTMDEVRTYNRALTSAEIAKLYSWAAGPIAHWNMDENTGTTANDSTGNGNTGTLTSGPTWVPGKFGVATYYDGSNDYTLVTDSNLLDVTTNFTISAWVYPTSLTGDQYIVTKDGVGTDTTDSYTFFVQNSGRICYHTNNRLSNVCPNAPTVDINSWNHVAIAFDDDTSVKATLYVDGVAQASDGDTTQAPIPLTTNLLIGREGNSGDEFNGKLDDIKIYNYTRTPGQIIEDMNGGHPAPGSPIGSSVAYWKFDEGYSTTAYDSNRGTGVEEDLTLSTATSSWSNAGKFGKTFSAGGARWLTRSDDADLDFAASADITMSLWINSTIASAGNPAATEYLINKPPSGATNGGYAVYANTSGQVCFGIDDDNSSFPEDSVCTSTDVYDNTWHFITAVKTGTSRLDMYVDGKVNGTPDTSISATTNTLENASTLVIASEDTTDDGDDFNGYLDEMQIFRSALTADSIKVLYNQNAGQSLGALSTDASNNPSFSATNEYCPPGQGSTCTPPVGHWKMDENTGTTSTFDISGNEYTGTMNGTMTTSDWEPGKFGSSLDFDDTDDYIGVGDVFYSDIFSISVWVNPRAFGAVHGEVINKRNGSGVTAGTNEYDLVVQDDGQIEFRTWDSGGGGIVNTTSANTITTNAWHHIAVTYGGNGGRSKVFVNGVMQDNDAIGSAMVNSTSLLQFASRAASDNASYFDGNIDDVRIYTYERTPAQVVWDMNRGAPVGWWKLDENSGTAANDSMGNSTAGTLTNTPTWAMGKLNTAVSFAGSNQQILVGDDSDFDFADDENMTLTTWFKHTAASAQEVILSKYAAAGYKIIMEADGDITCGLDYDSTWTPTDSATSTAATYDDDSWHHIACVKTGATSIALYIDGVLITTDASITATNTLTNADPMYFGIDADGTSNDFTGTLDDIRIYRYPLTSQQIKNVMGEGAVRFGP